MTENSKGIYPVNVYLRRIKKIKIIIWIMSVIFFLLVGHIVYNELTMDRLKIQFMTEYTKNENISKNILIWAAFYENDWLEILPLGWAESEYNKYAKSYKGAKGYWQFTDRTASHLRSLARNDITNLGIYDDDFQAYGANLYWATLRSYVFHTNEIFPEDVYDSELYNLGLGNWRAGRKTSEMILRYMTAKKFFSQHWKRYKNGKFFIFNRWDS